jgi:multiple sugar transport system permease protein
MRSIGISQSDRLFPYYSTLPAIIIIFLVGVIPTLYSIIISLQSYELVSSRREFVGLANYAKLVLHDPRFLHALAFSLIFGFVATCLELVFGFLIAYLLADKEVPNRYSALIRTILMVPFVCAPVVMSYTFKTLIYDRTFGYLNYFLTLLHMPNYDLFKGQINAPIGLLVMEVLLRTPFLVIVMYAGISSIDEAIYDAAEIDGISWLQRITRIVVPSIKAIILVGFVLRFMDSLKMFDEIFVLTSGGPGYTTENATVFIVEQGFTFFHMGYAAAAAFIFLVLVIVLISLLIRRIKF